MITVKTILSEIGENIIKTIQSNVSPSSNIYNGLSYNIIEGDGVTSLEVLTPDYYVYIDKGRRRGKFPPRAAIEDWVKRKGIPVQAIYPIQRKIGTQGIPAKNISEQIIKLNDISFSTKLEKWGLEEIIEFVNDSFNS